MKKLVLVVFAFALMLFIVIGSSLAAPTGQHEYPGNDTDLGSLYPGYSWAKLESVGVGSHPLSLGSGRSITINIAQHANGYTYVSSWTSNASIYYISIKGGNGFIVYEYAGGASSDSSALISPLNNGGNIADISHITVGYKIPTATSTPTSKPTSTPTSKPTSTPKITNTPTCTKTPGPTITNPISTPTITVPWSPTTEIPETLPPGQLPVTSEDSAGWFILALSAAILLAGVAIIITSRHTQK